VPIVENDGTAIDFERRSGTHEGGTPVDKASRVFTSKVSRRKLVQTGGAAAGAIAATGTLHSTFGAPYFAPRRFQGEKLTVLYKQSGT